MQALYKFIRVVVFAYTFTSVAAASAEDTALSISIGTIPHVIHEAAPGPHNEIFYTALLRAVTPEHKVTLLPYYRANRDLHSRQTDCLYVTVDDPPLFPKGSSDIKMPPSDSRYNSSMRFSAPINEIVLHAYTRGGEPIISSYADMNKKVIIGVRTQLQNVYRTIQEHGGIILYIEDYTKGFQLLNRGRADSVITYSMDVQVMLDKIAADTGPASVPKYGYDKNFTIRTVNEIAACWRSAEADNFLDAFNLQIDELRQQGRLNAIFSRYK